MKTRKDITLLKTLIIIGELILHNLAFFFVFYILEEGLSRAYFIDEKNFLIYFNIAYFFSISAWGIILHKRNVKIEQILDKVFKLVGLQALILIVIALITKSVDEYNIKFVVGLFGMLFCTSVSWRILMREIIKHFRIQEKNQRRMIILGSGNIAAKVYTQIAKNIHHSYKFEGFFDDTEDSFMINDVEHLIKGKLSDVIPFINEHQIEEIFCALPAGQDRKVIPILNYAENHLVRFFFVPDFKRFLSKKVNLQFFDDIPVVSLRTEPLEFYPNRLIKRCFDLIASTLFLVTLFPILLIVVGIAIKLSSKGSIFFTQKRTGEKGKEFTCIKFRSMDQNKDADEKQAVKGDERITAIGAFLRKTNLDETPQFLNVFIGDMSIVGPRPHMLRHTDEYSAIIDKYMLRHLSKPGITGVAQISGYRGETKDIREMEKRVARDVWYLENWTFWLDIKVIFQTAWLMITGDEKAY